MEEERRSCEDVPRSGRCRRNQLFLLEVENHHPAVMPSVGGGSRAVGWHLCCGSWLRRGACDSSQERLFYPKLMPGWRP